MKRFRNDGFRPEELKLYWNPKQIEKLCPDASEQIPFDPSDSGAVDNLRQYPVSERNHRGRITYVTNGIEKAVFDIPEDAQIILLNFAVNKLHSVFHNALLHCYRMNNRPVVDI